MSSAFLLGYGGLFMEFCPPLPGIFMGISPGRAPSLERLPPFNLKGNIKTACIDGIAPARRLLNEWEVERNLGSRNVFCKVREGDVLLIDFNT